MNKKEEKSLCKKVFGIIAKHRDLSIKDFNWPDEEERNEQAVDMLVKCSNCEVVLEHTRIESFPNQVAQEHMIKQLFDGIKTNLNGQLPTPGNYDVTFNVDAIIGAKDTGRIQKAMVKWIKEKAPQLKLVPPFESPTHMVCEQPDDVPFVVSLYRWHGDDGRIRVILNAPDNLEDKRYERIEEALEKKCPKLHAAKGDNRSSVLLLESNDISLGNFSQISNSVLSAISGRDDMPDDIYLVETEIEPWILWCIKEGLSTYKDLQMPLRFKL